MEVWGGLLGEKLAKDLAGEGERSGLGTGSGAGEEVAGGSK